MVRMALALNLLTAPARATCSTPASAFSFHTLFRADREPQGGRPQGVHEHLPERVENRTIGSNGQGAASSTARRAAAQVLACSSSCGTVGHAVQRDRPGQVRLRRPALPSVERRLQRQSVEPCGAAHAAGEPALPHERVGLRAPPAALPARSSSAKCAVFPRVRLLSLELTGRVWAARGKAE